ncbi:hypothetical protein GCM10011492_02890 [Flexivirga endophytica]|uniref:Uncharacterized protein n=1 Tax=Flexivirga endophytica TaxID=1849103 RepID=A0A916SU86_9MICO|nr:hypothetical protein [Flexivirga endophytica]GGB16537.1 hypothetical protein GCM10011492_02890 [Flexivirga endophytica]GHB39008.1 hypothetical protein GCM10008112_04720 [Flexivirga endophytica]
MILRLADAESRADLVTYVGRARQLDDSGAMRLQAMGGVLAAWVGVLSGQGLTRAGTTLGLRALPLAEPAQLDVVVPLAGLSDRFAREPQGTELPVPPTEVRADWAAVSPPQGGWQRVGEIPVQALNDVAAQGIAEIAAGAPEGSGAHAVDALRRAVWSRPMPTAGDVEGMPAAVAFASYALGFAVGPTAQVYAAGHWHRVTTPAGHVLVR